MPRIKKSSPITFTEDELRVIAFLSANIAGDTKGTRGITDSIYAKCTIYFNTPSICDEDWYREIWCKCEDNPCIHFRR